MGLLRILLRRSERGKEGRDKTDLTSNTMQSFKSGMPR
jgi:hypothetical protein